MASSSARAIGLRRVPPKVFVVPRPLRNAVYNLIASNRYRIFGKYDECFVPDADMRARVME